MSLFALAAGVAAAAGYFYTAVHVAYTNTNTIANNNNRCLKSFCILKISIVKSLFLKNFAE